MDSRSEIIRENSRRFFSPPDEGRNIGSLMDPSANFLTPGAGSEAIKVRPITVRGPQISAERLDRHNVALSPFLPGTPPPASPKSSVDPAFAPLPRASFLSARGGVLYEFCASIR